MILITVQVCLLYWRACFILIKILSQCFSSAGQSLGFIPKAWWGIFAFLLACKQADGTHIVVQYNDLNQYNMATMTFKTHLHFCSDS